MKSTIIVHILPLLSLVIAREPVGDVQLNKDSHWDVGFLDWLSSAYECQRACSLQKDCNSWGYNAHRNDRRCHFSNRTTPRADVTCENDITPCSYFGLRSDTFTPSSILSEAISKASGVCTGALQGEEAFNVASDLNSIIRSHYLDNAFADDIEFTGTILPAAVESAATILQGETGECYRQYTKYTHACKYGSYVFHQLRALLLYNDGNAKRAWPKKRNKFRKKLFNKRKIFIADNGFFKKKSLRSLLTFYNRLDTHLRLDGILYDGPLFATQTVRDAWTCEGSSPNLSVSNRGYNVFKTQVGDIVENGFPTDTPNPPPAADLQMVVTRHEVAHQFDRIMYNRNNDGDTKLYDMFISLKEASKGSDSNWLRSQVGDDYFQGAPQEIIASHIGNQYLHSTTAQLRLAAIRFQHPTWTSWEQDSIVEIPTKTHPNHECSYQSKNLGNIATPEECASAALADFGCTGNVIMFPNAYTSWGCRCCKAIDTMSCVTEEQLYTGHELWDLFKYKNTPNVKPTCSSTGLPMSWFLFNVELMTPVGSSIVKFYENEVNGKAKTYEVSLGRDDQGRINMLQIPNCGTIDITYSQDYIVNSVSESAWTCFIPPE